MELNFAFEGNKPFPHSIMYWEFKFKQPNLDKKYDGSMAPTDYITCYNNVMKHYGTPNGIMYRAFFIIPDKWVRS